LILADSPKVATCPEVEVRLGHAVSKIDRFSMSPVGEVLEPGVRGVGDLSSKVSMVVPESSTVVSEPATTVMASTVGSVIEASVLALSISVVSDGFPDALREGLATVMVCPASSYSVVNADPYVSPVVSFSSAVEEASVKTD
jgi:hypothetical protein